MGFDTFVPPSRQCAAREDFGNFQETTMGFLGKSVSRLSRSTAEYKCVQLPRKYLCCRRLTTPSPSLMAKSARSGLHLPKTVTAGSEELGAGGKYQAPLRPTLGSNALVEQFKRFKESGPPSRLLFFRGGSWVDFPREVFDVLRDGFVAGKTALEVAVGGSSHFFDFLGMVQVDLDSGASNSIAWIDDADRCFFPQSAVDDKLAYKPSTNHKTIPSSSSSSSSSSSLIVSSEKHSSTFRREPSDETTKWPGMELLRDEDRDHKIVSNLFLAGTWRFDPNITIVSIRKCLYSTPPRSSRLKAFQTQIVATKAARGSENIKFGWLATSPRDMAAIIAQGFEQANSKLLRCNAHSVGLHLSPPHSPYPSVLMSEVDDSGTGHILLCRTIMGRVEKVEAGSLQHRPSSDEFDGGVDDLDNPKWYIVWSTHMNTHILLQYVISYRSSKRSQGQFRSSRKLPVSSLPFCRVFAEIRRTLPSSMVRALELTYRQYRRGEMSKEAFIRYLRSTVGDKLLASTICRIRGY